MKNTAHVVAVGLLTLGSTVGPLGCASTGSMAPTGGGFATARIAPASAPQSWGSDAPRFSAPSTVAPAATATAPAPSNGAGRQPYASPVSVAPPAYASMGAPAAAGGTAMPPAPPVMHAEASGSFRADDSGPAASEAPSPAYRPGLATQWGETRTSEMSYAPFVRGSVDPFDTAAIYYNDAEGVVQQSAYHNATQPVGFVGAYHNGVRVSLRDEAGAPLEGYVATDRLYVMGHAGQRYTILIENTTPARFETVVSVDGLDVINGQPATPGNRGYILQAYGSLAIEGFRQDPTRVAAFRFGAVGDSYAAQTGSARNVGVIGVALFAERGAVLVPADSNEVQLRETANPFPGQFATPPARRYY